MDSLSVDVSGLFGTQSHVVDSRELSSDERANHEFAGHGEVNAVGDSQRASHVVDDGATAVMATLRRQEMPHRLERDAGRRRRHLTVDRVERTKTLAVALGSGDRET